MQAFGSFGFVMGQISTATLDDAKAAGVTLVIQNRPDGEAPGQPASTELASYAADLGLEYKVIDIKPGELSVEKIEAMAKEVGAAEGKILSFCAGGGRAASMMALGLARAGKEKPDALIDMAADAGQNISGLSALLKDVASA